MKENIKNITLRKALAIILVVALAFAMSFAMSTTASFAKDKDVYTEGALEYTIDKGSITITGYFGNEKTVTISSQIGGYPVNTIGKGAFINTGIKKLNLPDTITEIQEGAIDQGITIVYNSNTKKPKVVKPGDTSKKASKSTSKTSKSISKGMTFEVSGKTFTVTKGKSGSSLKGTKLKDSNGNKYTVDGKDNIISSNGKKVGKVPESAVMSIKSGDNVQTDEANVSLDDVDSDGPTGSGADGTGTGGNSGNGSGSHTLLIVIIILAVIAAAGIVFVIIRKRRM